MVRGGDRTRPRLTATGEGGGGMAVRAPPSDSPTQPHQKMLPQDKNEIYQRAPK